MVSEQDRINNNKNKIEFFMRENLKVHVDKTDNFFYNGFIVKKLEEGIYIFKDDLLGDQHLFLSEIFKVEEFRELKEKPKYNNF